jgi:hypothetical protein
MIYDDLMTAADFATSSAAVCVFVAILMPELAYDLDPTPLICHNDIGLRNVWHAVANARIIYAEMLAHCSNDCKC